MIEGTTVTASNDAAAACVWALLHVLGVKPDQVHSLTITPDAGHIRVERFTDEMEPDPYSGNTRPKSVVDGVLYRTPLAIAQQLVAAAS